MAKKSRRLFSRPPVERMMQIHQRIQSGSYPNSSQLAEEIEVTTRTIKRDVDFMKSRLEMLAACSDFTRDRKPAPSLPCSRFT